MRVTSLATMPEKVLEALQRKQRKERNHFAAQVAEEVRLPGPKTNKKKQWTAVYGRNGRAF
jgi:hypothetical protein